MPRLLTFLLGLLVGLPTFLWKLYAAETAPLLRQAPFDPVQGVFQNQVPGDVNQDMKLWPFLKDYLGDEIRTPSEPLPIVKPDWGRFIAKDQESLKWIWLGHSGLYLNIHGTRVILDLVLAAAASPLPFLVRRYQDPITSYAELPEPHVIVLSHDHYDHLDQDLIAHFASSAAQFLVPLGLSKRLQEFGVSPDKIQELNWNQTVSVANVSFTAAPAQHFSGRGLFDRNETLWASWILKSRELSLYFSGDSGYGPHFQTIGKDYGPFDLAFLDCGQYSPYWRYVHLLPTEVITAAKELRANAISPIHWGVFSLALHDWFEPVEEITTLAQAARLDLWHPQQGELNRLSQSRPQHAWWREHPDYKRRKKDKSLPETSP